MVTKRQQLKWLAKRFESLPFDGDSIIMSDEVLGYLGHEHKITNQELKQERDKMSGKSEDDNSWYERGELPPVGTICEMIDDRATWRECKIIAHEDGACIGWIASLNSPFYTYDKSEFRPLRTEREKAIDEMIKLIGHGYMSAEMARELAIKMYDAGFHE